MIQAVGNDHDEGGINVFKMELIICSVVYFFYPDDFNNIKYIVI